MKKPLSLILALCLLSGLCAVAEPAAPMPLHDGVYWGMSASDFAAAHGVNEFETYNNPENDRVTAAFFSGPFFDDYLMGVSALIIGVFIDDRLVCIGWVGIPESYADICAAFSSVCGPATENTPEHLHALLDTRMNDLTCTMNPASPAGSSATEHIWPYSTIPKPNSA